MQRTVCLAWATVMILALPGSPGLAAAPGASLCTGAIDESGPPRCYPAAQVGAAQRAMARTAVPVWPGTVVWNVAHLRLTQAEVRQPGRPLEIRYLFGTLGSTGHPVVDSDLGRSSPYYVLVGELHAPVSGSLNRVTSNRTGAGGTYWTFYANFRCRKLSLSVATNERRRIARNIGRGMLRAEACGKQAAGRRQSGGPWGQAISAARSHAGRPRSRPVRGR
jgi:hypothetical protein